jgi:hypothetical protein
MRVVTPDAGRQWIMCHRVYLREAGWTGSVVGVTARAELALARRRRLDFNGIRHVRSRRTVAGLTRHPAVIPSQPGIHEATVAKGAFLLARVLLLVSGDRV